jgi:diguanylate cyclase (GGDEF)-like protein/PAS domain S-box-containing protein
LRSELLVAAAMVVGPVLALIALTFVLLSAGSSRLEGVTEEARLESAASAALLRDVETLKALHRPTLDTGAPVESGLERTADRIETNLARAARFDGEGERRSAREAATAFARAREDLALGRKAAFVAGLNQVTSATIGLIEDDRELRAELVRAQDDQRRDSLLLYLAAGLSLLLAAFLAHRVARRLGAAFNAEAQHRALHDALTGVGNRDLLAERFAQSLDRAQRGGSPPSLLFVDLDAFKSVNDSLGHARGDQLLKAVAGRLQGCVRSVETVARVSGDEFALLVEWAEGQDRSTGSAIVAERVLDSIAVPFEVAGRTLSMTVSIGIAHARAGQPIDHLLRDADFAMYASKACGHGGYRYFHSDLQPHGADRLERIAELREAVADESFSVRYQPIFDLQTGQLVAAEALVRWEHPERGIVAPGDFIPLAEETGLIVPLGRSVLMQACVQVAAWNRENPHRDPLFVGVNLSPRQFVDPALIEDVRAALSKSGLPPERLTLEITETAVISDIEAAILKLERLRLLGVWIALADFGTGQSSLSHLRRLPVSHLKIARPFVERMETSPKDLALVRGIIAMTHGLNQRVIAEGVETTGQRDLLRKLGCDLGQGFLYSQPMPAHELGAALAKTTLTPEPSPRPALGLLDHGGLLRNLPDLLIVFVDRRLRIVAARGAALEKVARNQDGLQGKSLREVLPPDRAESLELILKAVFSGRRHSFEWASVKGDRFFEVEAEPIRDSLGQVSGAVLVARDVTESRHLAA